MNPINVDPEIMHGTPCFAGTRVPVKNLFDYIEANHPLDDFFTDFPSVPPEQVRDVLHIARERLLKSTAA
jgi:uncharacterized protein (DUF433 family)